MKKEWLIRTKNNHILGPVSLKKVRELFDNGSIKADDEVSCGNGYWFFIREKELVEKYILNENKQDFNPVSEADTVLTEKVKPIEKEVTIDKEANCAVPSSDDLEYPDMSITNDTVEVDDIEDDALLELRDKISNEVAQENLDINDDEVTNNILSMKTTEESKDLEHVDPVMKNRQKVENLKATRSKAQSSLLSQNILFIIAGILFILAVLGFYFRKTLIKEIINSKVNIISPVYAQIIPETLKKK